MIAIQNLKKSYGELEVIKGMAIVTYEMAKQISHEYGQSNVLTLKW